MKLLGSCSNGSLMFKPTEMPPAFFAPLFAASIIPGPPPVITPNPFETINSDIFIVSL